MTSEWSLRRERHKLLGVLIVRAVVYIVFADDSDSLLKPHICPSAAANGPGGKPADVDGDEQMMLAVYKSMPDLKITIEEMIAEVDKVACRNIWRWTDTASGEKMQFHGFVLWRFEGNRIAKRWATVTPPAEGTAWLGGPAKKSA